LGRGPLSLVLAIGTPHTWMMTDITETVGVAGLFLAGGAAWYARWRRRVASALEQVPVRTDRPAPVARHGAERRSNFR
jgi:hypothetical protein